MRARRLALAAGVLAVTALSCRGPSGPGSIREVPAAEAGAAFVIDDLGKTVEHVSAFVSKLTARAGATQLAQTRASIKQQFGLDPLDVATYEGWGIDTKGGLALFTEGAEAAPILALPVKDRAKLDASLKSTVARADGASKLSTETVGPYTLNVAGRPFGTEVAPAMLWAHVGRFVLVARPEGRAAMDAALKRLGATAGRAPANLGTDATFRELEAKLQQQMKQPEAVIFARGATAGSVVTGGAALSKGTITGLTVSGDGVDANTFLSLAIPDLERALGAPPVADLASRVGDDAVLVALSRGARPEALAALRAQPSASALIDRAFAPLRDEVGLDVEKDVVPLLAGPVTASVHVQSLDELAAQVRQRSASMRGLLDFVHVVITAEVKDPNGMLAVLERSRASLQKRGIAIGKKTVKVAGKDAVEYLPVPRGAPQGAATPKLGWALVGNQYVYAAGQGRLDRALALVAGGGPSMAGKLGEAGQKLASEPGATVVVLRGGALADAAKGAVPAGAAQGGFDALAGGLVEILRSLGDVAAGVTAEPGGIRLRIREQLQ